MSKATFPLLLFLVGCISAARAMATRITPVIENMAVSKTVAVFGLVKELERWKIYKSRNYLICIYYNFFFLLQQRGDCTFALCR